MHYVPLFSDVHSLSDDDIYEKMLELKDIEVKYNADHVILKLCTASS